MLLHVVESFSFASVITGAFSRTQDTYETSLEGDAGEKLKAMADKVHRSTNVPVSTFVAKGKIAKTIDHIAGEKNIDLIIMGTHGSGKADSNVAGSNAYKVALNAPCPVLTVQGHAKKLGFHNIVLPIDNTPASRQKVPIAVEIAKNYRAVIHIVGLNNLSSTEFHKRFEIKIFQVRDFIEEHEIAFTVKMLQGSRLVTPLMDYATQVNADLMVIMNDQDGASTASIINQSQIPVLTMKPDEGDPEKISLGY
jgi:nucleotide-binding universal stress UspA family protein